jgi:putative heme iron utilization protein
MNRTVEEHIRNLEEKRNLLSGRMMEEADRAKCNQLESELRAVESALTLFRSALEIEARISLN